MHLADLVRSEHDTFSCWPLKNTTREQISLLYFEKKNNTKYTIVKIKKSIAYIFQLSEKELEKILAFGAALL